MLIGQNWWCSLFPVLCFTDSSNGKIDSNTQNKLMNNLNNEEYHLLLDNSSKIQFKFKIIELFNNKLK